MTDSSFYILIDLFIAGCGIYIIVQYILMIRSRELRQNMMMPKDLKLEKCRDVEGYIHEIGTKQLVYGIVAVLCGGAGLAQDAIGLYNVYVSTISMVVFFILCIWYGLASKKAIEKFW
ncbi:MAG: hypothetical protein LUI07_08940 [Lachnospiraceae bacterium]|nr:hypothetical protein [Lachnospiraceae bacterium]